ncbi:hypothetical protein RA2_01241 [Roseovarius sp. A-2]|nr:hypothetical protein RA2_01241 [Roseovarius sp. A-2]
MTHLRCAGGPAPEVRFARKVSNISCIVTKMTTLALYVGLSLDDLMEIYTWLTYMWYEHHTRMDAGLGRCLYVYKIRYRRTVHL